MKYQLVVFDCDGTLVDTIADVIACFNEALVACGFPKCPSEVVSSLVGKPLEDIVRGLIGYGAGEGAATFSDDDVAKVSSAYRSIYAASDKPLTRPFPGMVELVDDLLGAGIAVAVNSNKVESMLVPIVERCFPGRDIGIVGYVPDRPTKPDPAGALKVAADAGVSAAESVYVGDTQVDFDTAINAGMECVIMTWGQGTDELYARTEFVACCDSADQLRAVLFDAAL